jgi:hypothetical protein
VFGLATTLGKENTLKTFTVIFTPATKPPSGKAAHTAFTITNVRARRVLSSTKKKPFDKMWVMYIHPQSIFLLGGQGPYTIEARDVAGYLTDSMDTFSKGYKIPEKGEMQIMVDFMSRLKTKWNATVQYDLNYSDSTMTNNIRQILFSNVVSLDPIGDPRSFSVMLGFQTPDRVAIPNLVFFALGMFK